MREGAFEDRLVPDRRDLVDALLDVLPTDLPSSSLSDAVNDFLSSVYVSASHPSIFVLETVRSVFYCISSQFCCGVPSNGESLLPFLIATTATV